MTCPKIVEIYVTIAEDLNCLLLGIKSWEKKVDQLLPSFLGHILILFGVFLGMLIVSFCGLWLLNSSVIVIRMFWVAAVTTPREYTRKLYSEAILNRNWKQPFTVYDGSGYDPRMNHYRRALIREWLANTAILACTSARAVVNYIVKYVSGWSRSMSMTSWAPDIAFCDHGIHGLVDKGSNAFAFSCPSENLGQQRR